MRAQSIDSGEYPKLYFAFSIYISLALYNMMTTPILPAEARIFYSPVHDISTFAAHIFYPLLPGAPGLRLPFFLISTINLFLYFRILGFFFDKSEDRIEAFFLYLFLPGVVASFVLASSAPIAIFSVLAFYLSYRKGNITLQTLSLLPALFSDTASFSLYLAIFIYTYKKGDNKTAILSAVFLILSLLMGSYSFSGRPKGHLVELLGLYAAVFSPLLFIYYFYSLYRGWLEGRRDLLRCIAFVSLALSMLLSIRQKIHIIDFSPYIIPGIFIALLQLHSSLRIRMRRYRKGYRVAASIVVGTMFLSSMLLLLHRPIYRLLGNPENFFLSSIYRPYDLAESLRRNGVGCYDPDRMEKKYHEIMRFYAIPECTESKK